MTSSKESSDGGPWYHGDSSIAAEEVMQGFPPPLEARPTLSTWDHPPFNRWSFQNVRQIIPTAEVRRGDGEIAVLPHVGLAFEDLTFADVKGETKTVGQMLRDTYSDGFIVLHQGRIVAEQYLGQMAPETQHLSQSVGKSITAAAAGALIQEGLLDPQAPVSAYVPETAGQGYGDAKIDQLLDMTSGVAFTEDYDDPESDVSCYDRTDGWKPRRPGDPASIYEFLPALKQERPHGGVFNYRSCETDMLGWVMERAAGTRVAEVISSRLWAKLGCERDASLTVDSAGGAIVSGGFNATLRDYARFGQMQLDLGYFNGLQIVPEAWVCAARSGDQAKFKAGYAFADRYPRGAYARKWWILDCETGCAAARGVFGQLIYVNPASRVVAVKLSSWPTFLNPDYSFDTLRAIEAIEAAVR